MKTENDFDFFYKKKTAVVEPIKEVIPLHQYDKDAAMIQASVFLSAIAAGILKYLDVDNIAIYFMLMIGYLGGSLCLQTVFDITFKKACYFVLLGGLAMFLMSFLPISDLLAPFAGVVIVTGVTVLIKKGLNKLFNNII